MGFYWALIGSSLCHEILLTFIDTRRRAATNGRCGALWAIHRFDTCNKAESGGYLRFFFLWISPHRLWKNVVDWWGTPPAGGGKGRGMLRFLPQLLPILWNTFLSLGWKQLVKRSRVAATRMCVTLEFIVNQPSWWQLITRTPSLASLCFKWRLKCWFNLRLVN